MANKKRLKPDPVLKDYWREGNRFADLFNQVFFNGNKSIDPNKLSNEDTEESAMIKEGGQTTSISRNRDIIKQYAGEAELVLISLENQKSINYAMPVRSMLYDALRYTRQCKELENQHRADNDLKGSDEFLSGITKTDRIKPVISLVVYYGEKAWDGPACLNDMMDVPDLFRKFYNDQRIHLLQVRDVNGYEFQNQDNRDFFTMIREFYNNDGNINLDDFRIKYQDMDVYWETLAAIGAATGSARLIEYAHNYEGGRISMCTALENLERQGEIRGEKRGEIRGEKRGEKRGEQKSIHKTVNILRQLDISDEIIMEKIKKEYKLNDKEAHSFLV